MEFRQKIIAQIAEVAPVYLVGGTVRDSLLQRPSKDVDGIVALPLETLDEHLRKWGYHPLKIGAKHQTLTVFHQGERIDFNPFSGDLETDALRRDFTINAIYQDGGTGEIIDPLGGREDLEKGILRGCGDPYERFHDDPLRILRMVRFSIKYNLAIEEETFAAAKEVLPKISDVAVERISEELGSILTLDKPGNALKLLDEIGYIDMYFPELALLKGLKESPNHTEDLWEHTLRVVENTPPQMLLRLGGLFHHLEKYKQILTRFRFSMVLGKDGKGKEKELVWLLKNRKNGKVAFCQELQGRTDLLQLEGKIRSFIWENGWTGRTFHAERVKNLLALWRADYYGFKTGEPRESGEDEYFEELLSVLKEETEVIQKENQDFQWEPLEEFASRHKIKGRDWGAFKGHLRKKMILEKVQSLTQEFLVTEFKEFRKKKY